MVHDISQYLAGRGHEVDIIVSKPGRTRVRREGPITIYYLRQLTHPLLKAKRLVPRFDTHGWKVLPLLLKGSYDLIHTFFYTFAPSVRICRRLRGTPYIYHVVCIPPHWSRTFDSWMLNLSLAKASGVRVFSDWCKQYMVEHYGTDAHVLAPTVDREMFRPQAGKRDIKNPKVIFTADLNDQRKGGDLLIRAFNLVHKEMPNARLQLAGPIGFGLEHKLSLLTAEAIHNVEVLGTGSLASLPTLYASASATVLPSIGEPFGMVLTESLSAGTPVVGTRSGAIPEILDDPQIGTLFDRDTDEMESSARLASAIRRTLELSKEADIHERCRTHAQRYTWQALGPLFEILQDQAMTNPRKIRRE
jgi:glycosyltransferase involved in cell wall biosynthesis